MGERMSGERAAAVAEKQRTVLELKKAGLDFRRIAQQVGYGGPSGAHKAYRSALKEIIREPAEEVRDIEVARLDDALVAIWPLVKKGNLQAIDRFLRISERRSGLLGLDAPKDINLGIDPTAAIRLVGVDPGDV